MHNDMNVVRLQNVWSWADRFLRRHSSVLLKINSAAPVKFLYRLVCPVENQVLHIVLNIHLVVR